MFPTAEVRASIQSEPGIRLGSLDKLDTIMLGHRSATELNDFANSGVLTSVPDHSKAVSRLPRSESVAQ